MSTLSTIIEDARRVGHAAASSWTAHVDSIGCVILAHYGCQMVNIDPSNNLAGMSPGYGSVSDKQGVNKALAGAGSSRRYSDLFS